MIELETSPWRGKAQHKVDSEGLSAEEKYYPVVSKGKKKGPSEASKKSDYRLGHQEIVKLSFQFFLYSIDVWAFKRFKLPDPKHAMESTY